MQSNFYPISPYKMVLPFLKNMLGFWFIRYSWWNTFHLLPNLSLRSWQGLKWLQCQFEPHFLLYLTWPKKNFSSLSAAPYWLPQKGNNCTAGFNEYWIHSQISYVFQLQERREANISNIIIKASEMLVAPRISECFGLPWSALVCCSLPWSALVCLGLLHIVCLGCCKFSC